MPTHAYSSQPVILFLHTETGTDAFVMRRRLAGLFKVSQDSIYVSSRGRLHVFYIAGSYTGSRLPDMSMTDSRFTASAAPVLDPKLIAEPTPIMLDLVAQRLFASGYRSVGLPGPMALFHADFQLGKAWAANDPFGVGRLYSTQESGRFAVSNHVLAAALTRETRVEGDATHWDAYYTTGGAVGAHTYVKGVERLPGGTLITLSESVVSVHSAHSLESSLLRDGVDGSLPLGAAVDLLRAARPLFTKRPSIGLSGGRDSRLVTALALASGLDFQSYTVVPPDLEGSIAQVLHEKSSAEFDWEIRDRRLSPSDMAPAASTYVPILERAERWFEFTGGDNWSTYVRQNPRPSGPIRLGGIAISGAFGDYTRGHYYSRRDIESKKLSGAVDRHWKSLTAIRRFVPLEVRERGALQVRAQLDQLHEDGFTGVYALDLSFLLNRVRRQYPHPAPRKVSRRVRQFPSGGLYEGLL